MKTCPECGIEVDELVRTCPECGFPFAEEDIEMAIKAKEEEAYRMECEALQTEQVLADTQKSLEERRQINNDKRLLDAQRRIGDAQKRAEIASRKKAEIERLLAEAEDYEKKLEAINNSEMDENFDIDSDEEVIKARQHLEEAKVNYEEKMIAVKESDSEKVHSSVIKNQSKKKKSRLYLMRAGIGGIIVIVAIVTILLNYADPISKYESLVKSGKTDEAEALYKDQILTNEDLNAKLIEEQTSEMDKIYQDFYDEKISYEDAINELAVYSDYESSKKYSLTIKKKITSLNTSRKNYDEAVKLESNGDLQNAIKKYKAVIEEDDNYENAQAKVELLTAKWKESLLDDASNYASNKQYKEAIASIDQIISVLGEDEELNSLKEEYESARSEQYVKVIVTSKSVTPKDTDKWIFSYYVNFVFSITNNSDKSIQGVEGRLIAYDLFGKEILSMGCDFTGTTIAPGETYIETGLAYECNEFRDSDMKLYNTDFNDLKFSYEVLSVVYTDGSTVVPE